MSVKNKSEQIPIYGKDTTIKSKLFDSLDEFQSFYNLHKSEIDELSTVKLNRIYKIKDYKITRRKLDNEKEDKQLCFQLIKTRLQPNNEPNVCENIVSLENKMKLLEIELSKIKEQVIEIVRVLNGGSN